MATGAVGESAAGLTTVRVVVTVVTWEVGHAEVVATAPVEQAGVVAELEGWLTAVVVVAVAVVVGGGVTTIGAAETAFMTEFAALDWHDNAVLDRSSSFWSVASFSGFTGDAACAVRALCGTKAETLVPLPFCAIATMWFGSLCRAMVGVPRSRATADCPAGRLA